MSFWLLWWLSIYLTSRSLQVDAGISSDIYSPQKRAHTHDIYCWFLGLRNFCAKHRVYRFMPRPNRVPSSLPDNMISFSWTSRPLYMPFKRQELVDMNLIRIYLQVYTITDIVTAVLADHSISQSGKSSLSATAGVTSHFPIKKRLQHSVNNGAK
jgi:hypothetical protein